MIKIEIVLYFIFYSLYQGINPWRFFQINAKYFNEKKGIFSKYEIEETIPSKYKLKTCILNTENKISIWEKQINSDFTFPLFLKPEWGQNSYGIYRVDEKQYLNEILKEIKNQGITYLCQELAQQKKEYEILYIKNKNDDEKFLLFVITETINTSGEKYAIQGIHNNSKYKEINKLFSNKEINNIYDTIRNIGDFKFARVGIKADNIKGILDGNFKIFEINIFLPLSLNLLDENISKTSKNIFLKKFVKILAIITKESRKNKTKNIFWKMIKKHYIIKLNNKLG